MNNDKDCLIGAVVGLQQSHMLEQERQRASLDWNNQDKLEQSHIWRGDKETVSIETARFNLRLRQLLVVQFHTGVIGSKVNKLVFVSKKVLWALTWQGTTKSVVWIINTYATEWTPLQMGHVPMIFKTCLWGQSFIKFEKLTPKQILGVWATDKAGRIEETEIQPFQSQLQCTLNFLITREFLFGVRTDDLER